MLLGACTQACLALLVRNKYYAFLPAGILLSFRVINALLIHFNLKKNPFLEKAILKKRFSAVVPNADGRIRGAGQEKVVILLLGAKSNHPFGFFAPEFLKTFKWMAEMNAEFDKQDGPNGCKFPPLTLDHRKKRQGLTKCFPQTVLGQTGWQRKDERGAMEFVFISYWRGIDDLHAFAHGPVHRPAWLWWEKTIKQHDMIGINHEIYEADKGHWENMYVNFQPTGLGATTFLRRGDKLEGGEVSDEWISPLVDASRGRLKSSSGRLGVAPTRFDRNRPDANVY